MHCLIFALCIPQLQHIASSALTLLVGYATWLNLHQVFQNGKGSLLKEMEEQNQAAAG